MIFLVQPKMLVFGNSLLRILIIYSPQYDCILIILLISLTVCSQLCDNEPAIQGNLSTVSLFMLIPNNVIVVYCSRYPLLLLAWCCTSVLEAALEVSVSIPTAQSSHDLFFVCFVIICRFSWWWRVT